MIAICDVFVWIVIFIMVYWILDMYEGIGIYFY